MEPCETLRAVAALARVDAPERDAERLAADFERVRAFAAALPPCPPDAPADAWRAVPALGLSGLRADEPTPSLPADVPLALAPERRGRLLAVPRAIDEA